MGVSIAVENKHEVVRPCISHGDSSGLPRRTEYRLGASGEERDPKSTHLFDSSSHSLLALANPYSRIEEFLVGLIVAVFHTKSAPLSRKANAWNY